MDIDKYISEAQRQLNDKNNYKELQTNPTLQHNKLVNGAVERFKKDKSILTKIADGLITDGKWITNFFWKNQPATSIYKVWNEILQRQNRISRYPNI